MLESNHGENETMICFQTVLLGVTVSSIDVIKINWFNSYSQIRTT